MLNTALRTSQQRVLGTAILQWDTFSLDVCHVLQFYREALAEPISHNNSFIILHHPWSSLYILESFGILTYFWKLLDTFGIYWRFVGDLSSGFHQLSSVIFSKYVQFWRQYLTKAAFSCLQTIKVTFSRCVSPLCLPVVSPQCVSPFLGRSPRASLSAFPLKKSKRMETDGYKMKQNETERIFHQSMKLKGLTVNTWSLWTL